MQTMTSSRSSSFFWVTAILICGMVLSISAYAMYGNAEKTHQQKATKGKAPQQKAATRKAPSPQLVGPQMTNAQTLRQVQSPAEMWEVAVAQPMAWHVERGSFTAASPVREDVNRMRDADDSNSNPAILVGLGIAMISIFRRIRRLIN